MECYGNARMRRFVGGGSLFCLDVEVRCRVLDLECQIKRARDLHMIH